MNPLQIKKQEKNKVLLKIIRWAQRKKVKVETLTWDQITDALRCKL